MCAFLFFWYFQHYRKSIWHCAVHGMLNILSDIIFFLFRWNRPNCFSGKKNFAKILTEIAFGRFAKSIFGLIEPNVKKKKKKLKHSIGLREYIHLIGPKWSEGPSNRPKQLFILLYSTLGNCILCGSLFAIHHSFINRWIYGHLINSNKTKN